MFTATLWDAKKWIGTFPPRISSGAILISSLWEELHWVSVLDGSVVCFATLAGRLNHYFLIVRQNIGMNCKVWEINFWSQ
jgi:hypothetical protein